MSIASRILVLTALAGFAGGCSNSTSEPSGKLVHSGNPPSDPASAGSPSISVNGTANDWQEVAPVWEEGGAVGTGDFSGSIDIKEVYFNNDDEFLYVFLRTSPTVQDRFQQSDTSGNLCDVFLDTDHDAATGCKDVDGFDYGKINGYDFRLWVPLGIQTSDASSQPYVSYELQPVDANGEFGFDSVATAQSLDSNALIAHGDEGVEMAIPLESLGVKSGSSIRLLLKEAVDPFDKRRYSEGEYVIR